MSLAVREHLMRHFAGRDDIIPGLKEASAGILLGMVAAAGDNRDQRLAAVNKLLDLGAYESESDIDAAVGRLKNRRRPLSRRVVAAVRGFVSKFIPRPRP